MSVDYALANKIILITGASHGLGSVAAIALASVGVSLILVARSESNLQSVKKMCNNSKKHTILPADLTNSDDIQRFLRDLGPIENNIDAILHCAGGGLGFRDPLLHYTEMETLFRLNVSALVEINRYLLPHMIMKKRGNIVHVCSIASQEATGSVGYNTVKAALAAYTRSLGREMAGTGVVVTGIMPGGFQSPENAMDRLQKHKPEVYQSFIEQRLPRKKMGQAEELVPLLMFLCSDAASMMGGCLVPIDAGEGLAYAN